jgi:hypothetical protein
MKVNNPTRGIEYDDMPLYAFERSIEDSELEFPSAKKETCCIQREVNCSHWGSALDDSRDRRWSSKRRKRGMLTYRD